MDCAFGPMTVKDDLSPVISEYMRKLTRLITHHARKRVINVTFRRIEEYLEKNKDIDIDAEDAHGRTPLMIACGEGLEDVALLLLGKGANPTKKCSELNTVLHFACRVDIPYSPCISPDGHPVQITILTRNRSWRSCRLNLVKILLDRGATCEPNIHGWTPAHYAAFYEMTDVVKYLWKDQRVALSISDWIMTFEILVFALSVFKEDFSSATKFLRKVLELRLEKGLSEKKDRPTELEECLGKAECTKLDDLNKVKDLDCMKVQGFLICDRVFPESVKDRWLWPSLFATYIKRPAQFYFRLCDMVQRLESKGKVAIGTLLIGLEYLLKYSYHNKDQKIDVVCQNEKQLLHFLRVHKDIIQKAGPNALAKRRIEIYKPLKSVKREIVKAIFMSRDGMTFIYPYLSALVDFVGVLNEAADKCNFEKYGTVMFNLYYTMMGDHNLFFSMRDDIDRFMIVMQAYSFLLEREDPSYHDPKTGRTVLHHLVLHLSERDIYYRRTKRAFSTRHTELVLQAVCKAIRYGCPVAFRNKRKCTALDVAQALEIQFAGDPEKYEIYNKLVKVLKDSPVDLTLQELAARVIIQKKIPYREKMPQRLCDFIDDDIV